METTNNGKRDEYYRALLEKDPSYLGLFFVGVKTTGIFCVPTCRARKPKLENTEFFSTVNQALVHGYRPCKICNPTEVTFHAYQRMVRINTAIQELSTGKQVLETALDSGYDSLSGFGYAYKKTTGKAPSKPLTGRPLVLKRFSTPLGPMCAVASTKGLCLLEFVERKMLETEIRDLSGHFKTTIIVGENSHTQQAEQEIAEYFAGTRTQFDLSLDAPGTAFQQQVWGALQTIPYGTRVSYEHIAAQIGSARGMRAVGTANGHNRIAIIIPCHRVIRKDGQLGGYGGGLERKKWLLDFEERQGELSHNQSEP